MSNLQVDNISKLKILIGIIWVCMFLSIKNKGLLAEKKKIISDKTLWEGISDIPIGKHFNSKSIFLSQKYSE